MQSTTTTTLLLLLRTTTTTPKGSKYHYGRYLVFGPPKYISYITWTLWDYYYYYTTLYYYH